MGKAQKSKEHAPDKNKAVYEYKYKPKWEKEEIFKKWLRKSDDKDIAKGKGEAYCSFCECNLRAHHDTLTDHAASDKHKRSADACPQVNKQQSTLLRHGFKAKSKGSKATDLKLAVHVACHSSVKTIDHLGMVLKDIAHGSNTPLEQLRLHRTKCGKLISNVVAPAMLRDLLDDIGDSWYSIIIDGSTDLTTQKFLAVMVKYYSFSEGKMIVDQLGMIETVRNTAEVVYEKFTEFMEQVGLSYKRMLGLGTDGGTELCGPHNSLFAYLKKKECPHLILVKCICHGLDNCASTAGKEFPSTLDYLLRESRSWFSHSCQRKKDYSELYKDLTDGGKEPPQLVKMGATRWLSYYGAVKAHSQQYEHLHELFKRAALAGPADKCHSAKILKELHDDGAHHLYLVFLRPILREVVEMNVAFQRSTGDISKLYKDLKTFIFTLAGKIVKPEALKQTQSSMLRLTELQALQLAVQKQDSFKPLELVNYGDSFWQTAAKLKLPDEQLRAVQMVCCKFLVTFIHKLTTKLPSCVASVEKLSAFTPSVTLAERGRPQFKDLPMDLVPDPDWDREAIETQWEKIATMRISDICPGVEDAEQVDLIEFWSQVYRMKTASGKRIFGDLARYVLSALTLPLSNAVVERLFSIMALVKNKIRNKLGLKMLESILRIRTHLHAHGKCCHDFEPSPAMIERFNSKVMYGEKKRNPNSSFGSVGNSSFEDNPDEPEEVLGAADRGDDGDAVEVHFGELDANNVAVPEWDEMFNLLAEMDAVLD